MKLVPYSNDHEDEWQNFARQHNSLYHDIRWKTVIEESYGLKSAYFSIFSHEKLTGLLPAFQTKKDTLFSLPYMPFSGFLQDSSNDFPDNFNEMGINTLIIKQKTNKPATENEYVTMIKQLGKSKDDTFQNFHHKHRNMIRRAEEQPFSLKQATVNEFYPIYRKATNALGTPAHNKRFFERIEHYFKNEIQILNLFLEEKAIGTILEMDYGNTRYDLWAFSLKQYLKYKPNVFLYWERLKDAINVGQEYYDFGRSVINSGTYNFKKKWGAEPVKLVYKKYDLSSTKVEDIPPQTGSLLPKIWAKLPAFVANPLGPIIRKHVY